MWLDDARGHLIDWTTQWWVRVTGRTVSFPAQGWLDGPAGHPAGIGTSFFDAYAAARGFRVVRDRCTGLVPDVSVLRSESFDPSAIAAEVVDFYTRTSDYELDAWSEWCGAFRPFGWALAILFSRRLQQLNVPLSGLDTSRGMTSEVFSIVDTTTSERVCAAWVRQLIGTGHVIYAGAYSTCIVPDASTPCVRVVFPLPNGNAIVLMRAISHDDGSLTLVSSGTSFGSPGFYFTVRTPDGVVRARYVRALRESIHVYAAGDEVRADHVLSLWGLTFLRLHYRLRRRATSTGAY